MKYFFRTTAGKIVLFVTCLFSVCVLLGSIIGATFFWDYGFYERSEEEQYSDRIMYDAVGDWLTMYNYGRYDEENGVRVYKSFSNLSLKVYDENGTLIARTQEVPLEERSYRYVVDLKNVANESNPLWDIAMISGDNAFRIYSIYYSTLQDERILEQTIDVGFIQGFPHTDRYMFMNKIIGLGYRMRYAIYVIGIFAGLLALVSFIMLMCVSGRRPDDDKIRHGLLGGMPFDIMTVGMFFIIAFFAMIADSWFMNGVEESAIVLIMFPVMIALFMGYCMSFATRLKEHSIIRKSFIAFLVRGTWKILKGIPTAWRWIVLIGVDCLVDVGLMALMYATDDMVAIMFLIIKTVVLVCIAVYHATKSKALERGAEAISRGNLNYQVDISGMVAEHRRTGEYLNTIAKGMSIAVEQRTKSERMKTELITNVSHDIKTPLTSIINYAGLIAKEECNNEKHAEYCEVLMRQSEKLKRLIENLVEASKAATGNLEVNLAPCDASVFLTQASGEYDDKLAEANLTLVVKQPDENLRIMADGRHMWRVFDNLMNNICKYSVPGTRVYLTLERDRNMAQFLFKNTSKEILDISEEELMERFVRGDSSRNTEGNGLGLSIAKSLAQLQNGWLRIETDGDLFKAILRFPLVDEAVRAEQTEQAEQAEQAAQM